MTKPAIGSDNDQSRQPAIDASWERCERQYTLARDSNKPIMRLQTSEVALRFEEMVERTGGRNGIFRQLGEIAASAGQCLVLTDADSVLVRLESKDKGSSDFEREGIVLGSCWDERLAGTNGVALAMSQNRPFTVRGQDHFYSKLSPFACTAAPLYDAENRMIGAINLSTIDRGNMAEYLFAQQLLGTSTAKVQRLLFERQFRDAILIEVGGPRKGLLLSGHELLAVGEKGLILGATAGAHQLVNLPQTSVLIGQSFESVFHASTNPLEQVPGRVVSTGFDGGPNLRVSLHQPVASEVSRAWQPPDVRRPQLRVRRRLPPALQELAIGSEAMASLCERARNFFERALPLVLEGETGTGKSAMITALHEGFGLAPNLMTTIDCALLGDGESDRAYLVTVLNEAQVIDVMDETRGGGATLVLDNLDDLPMYGQARLRNLMSAIETKGASNRRNLAGFGAENCCHGTKALARSRGVRPLSRGSVFPDRQCPAGLATPQRPRHARGSGARYCRESGGAEIRLTEDANEAIRRHDWPGSVLQQALISGDGRQISIVDFRGILNPVNEGNMSAPGRNKRSLGLKAPLDEKNLLLEALQGVGWNVAAAARNLGIGRATINRKIRAYDIKRPAKTPAGAGN